MYEVRKTDQGRFAVRLENTIGLYIWGTGLIVDTHNSNIAIYTNKDDAFQKAIEFNRSISELFNDFIDKDNSIILDELENQRAIIEDCEQKIEVLNCVLHCKHKRERR